MAGKYATKTSVPTSQSRAEIEKVLTKYGATQFAYGWSESGGRAVVAIGFMMHDRSVRFVLPLPARDDPAFTRTETGRQRSASAAKTSHDQAVRSSWRSLLLVIKAKLEAVASGVVTFEEEFAMRFVMPDGRTVAEHVTSAIDAAYQTGTVPPLLSLGPGPADS